MPAFVCLQDVASCSADEFELQYEGIFTFEIQRSDGLPCSLNTSAGGSGADVVVTMENRREFVAAVRTNRILWLNCIQLLVYLD